VASGSTPNSRFYLSWELTGQSVDHNTSTINWWVGWEGTTGDPRWWSNAIKIINGSIAGQGVAAGTWSNQRGTGDHCLRSGSVTIHHNGDGTGRFDSWITGWFYEAGNLSVSGSWDVPTIPRGSKASVSKASVALGGVQHVSITAASSSFTHNLDWFINDEVVYRQSNVAASFDVTVSPSWASAMKDTCSAKARVVVWTLNAGQVIASSVLWFTVTVPNTADYKPSFNASITRVDNGVPASWGVAVQHKSKATINVSSVKAGSGAGLKSWSISGLTQTLSTDLSKDAASWTTPQPLTESGSVKVDVTVTDTRGRSTTKQVTIPVVEWSPPTLSPDAVWRCNDKGVAVFNGTYASMKAAYVFAGVDGKNSVTSKVEYKGSAETAWSNAGALVSGARTAMGAGKIVSTSSYQLRLSVTDGLGGVAQYTWNLGTAQVDLDFRADATGMGIGGVGETKGGLDIWWPTALRKGLRPINLGASEDLNNLKGYGTPSLYHQSANASTSLDRHYPVAKAGLLHVVSPSNDFCYQTYEVYDGGSQVWHRTWYKNTWFPWQLFLTPEATQPVIASAVVKDKPAGSLSCALAPVGNQRFQVGQQYFAFPYNGDLAAWGGQIVPDTLDLVTASAVDRITITCRLTSDCRQWGFRVSALLFPIRL
jgi:hypothetical protein